MGGGSVVEHRLSGGEADRVKSFFLWAIDLIVKADIRSLLCVAKNEFFEYFAVLLIENVDSDAVLGGVRDIRIQQGLWADELSIEFEGTATVKHFFETAAVLVTELEGRPMRHMLRHSRDSDKACYEQILNHLFLN